MNAATMEPPTATEHVSILPKGSADASRVRVPSHARPLAALDSPAGLRPDSDAPGCKTLPMGADVAHAALNDERRRDYMRTLMQGLNGMGYTATARGPYRITARRRTTGDPRHDTD